jgi:hypothetical protein
MNQRTGPFISPNRYSPAERVVMATGALISWVGVGIEFWLVLQHHTNTTTAEAIVRFFSFFTIQINLLAACGFTFPLLAPSSNWGSFFDKASVRGGTAVYITMVGATYALLLRQLYHPQGLAKFADVLVHDVAPLFYIAYWLLLASKVTLRWKDAGTWLLYPLAYLVYTLIRGAFFDWYPYPFVDVNALGYAHVFINTAVFIVIFLSLGLLVVVIGRGSSRVATLSSQASE